MLNESQRFDLMLSSTSLDLSKHRQKSASVAEKAGFYVIQMENLTALNAEDAISISMKMVESADVFVCIIAGRYGYQPTDKARNPQGLSITELEYHRAQKLGIPSLIFLSSSSNTSLSEEDEESKKRLDAFRKDLGTKHIVAFFESIEDLELKLLQALSDDTLQADILKYRQQREILEKKARRRSMWENIVKLGVIAGIIGAIAGVWQLIIMIQQGPPPTPTEEAVVEEGQEIRGEGAIGFSQHQVDGFQLELPSDWLTYYQGQAIPAKLSGIIAEPPQAQGMDVEVIFAAAPATDDEPRNFAMFYIANFSRNFTELSAEVDDLDILAGDLEQGIDDLERWTENDDEIELLEAHVQRINGYPYLSAYYYQEDFFPQDFLRDKDISAEENIMDTRVLVTYENNEWYLITLIGLRTGEALHRQIQNSILAN